MSPDDPGRPPGGAPGAPGPTDPPDSPLGMLADATPAPVPRPAKKVVKKVVKKAVKKAPGPGSGAGQGAPPQSKPARPAAAVADAPRARPRPPRGGDAIDALLDDRTAPTERTLGSDATATIKGLVIIGLAVLLGFVLISSGYQRDGSLVAGRPAEVAESTTTTASPFYNTTTTRPLNAATTAPLKPPADVTVVVANAAKIPGTPAGDTTRKVSGAGYKTKTAVDDPNTVAATIVYYAEGYKGEAEALAKLLKLDPSKTGPMPSPQPTFAQGAQLVVELGPDFDPQSVKG